MGKFEELSMNNFTKEIDIIPDTSLWSKLGKNQYTIAKALSELIDNSIDAAEDKVSVDITYVEQGNIIIVKDNAKGMDLYKLGNAFKIAFHEGVNTIGEYGMGLQAATSYLGSQLYIFTKEKKNEIVNYAHHNEKNFEKWKIQLQQMDVIEAENLLYKIIMKNCIYEDINPKIDFTSGTIIVIAGLNVNLYPQLGYSEDRKGILITKFKKIYREFINNKKLELTLRIRSNSKLYIRKVECKDKESYILKQKLNFNFISLIDSSCKNVKGWIGLKDYNNKGIYESSGFSVTKGKKIILTNELIGYKFHPETRQITGNLELDDFIVLNNKSDFMRNSDWDIMEDFIGKVFVLPLKKYCKSTSNYLKELSESELRAKYKKDIKINYFKYKNKVDWKVIIPDYEECSYNKVVENQKEAVRNLYTTVQYKDIVPKKKSTIDNNDIKIRILDSDLILHIIECDSIDTLYSYKINGDKINLFINLDYMNKNFDKQTVKVIAIYSLLLEIISKKSVEKRIFLSTQDIIEETINELRNNISKYI